MSVTIFGRANLRTDPGKKKDTAGQAAKKNTNLGTLIEVKADSAGIYTTNVRLICILHSYAEVRLMTVSAPN